MSTIQNEIDRIKESVADAYETVELMGGDVPSPDLQKIDTLSDSIATIKGGSGGGGSENILLNWDFRNPVNRSGSTTYSLTTTRCTVDSWYSENGCAVNVVDGGVTFDPKNDATCVFGQNVKEWELMKGKTVTFSALVSNVSAVGLSLWIYGVEGPVALPAIEVGNDVALYSITGTVDNGASSLRCGIQAVSSTATIKMIAAKLEYGSKQTLAKQNSDNVWEILDPPNYDLQYILCSQYDAVTSAWIGPQDKITGTTSQTAGFDANGNLAAVASAPLADAIVSDGYAPDKDMNNAPRGKIVNYLYYNNDDQASYHSPMGELYGTTGETWYVVETFGVINRVVQTAATPYTSQRKFFIRFKHDTTWSPWREIASLSDIPTVSNPNLLLNWDFRNPVNRNGKIEYTNAGYTIDRWHNDTGTTSVITVVEDAITITTPSNTTNIVTIRYNFDIPLTGRYTLSIFVEDMSGLWRFGGLGGNNQSNDVGISNAGLNSYTLNFTNKQSFYIWRTGGNPDAYITIKAIKLELGEKQTLAKKNASGEWEIIDPPDYDLQYLLCSQYSPLTGEWIGSQHSNPNLLLNWDFRNPVNRNGKMEYSGNGYGIDAWFQNDSGDIRIDSDGLHLIVPSDKAGITVSSQIHRIYGNFTENTIVTFSCLFSGGTLKIGYYGVSTQKQETTGENKKLVYFSYTIPSGEYPLKSNANTYGPWIKTSSPDVTVYAAKLELGPVQTLSRQNTSGEWEIIDPPNYDLQYLLTSQYSPINGAYVGIQHSNPNLLDNWYFADPIFQRQSATYIASNKTYWIDRWYGSSNCRNAEIVDGGVKISNVIANQSVFVQSIENVNSLLGKQLTLSALIEDELVQLTATLPGTISENATFLSNVIGVFRVYIKCGNSIINAGIYSTQSNGSAIIKAMKLELGPIQTLAHKEGDAWVLNDPPPNKQQELAKCQRYYQRVRCSSILTKVVSNKYALPVPFKVSMRAKPVVTLVNNSLVINGVGERDFSETTSNYNWQGDQNVMALLFEGLNLDADVGKTATITYQASADL